MTFDAAVVGLGYVGLPLAREACRANLRVAGYDTEQSIVEGLVGGRSHVGDVSSVDLQDMVAQGFVATSNPAVLGAARAVVVCVPTPLTENAGPDLGAVRAAAATVARHLRPGTLVVLESTSYPGTTDEVFRPILEHGSGLAAGVDFHLAFSPERIDPGNKTHTLAKTPKVVGGLTPACTDAAAAFYGRFVERVVRAKGTREAEMSKLLENIYRHVNIALVNELAMHCHELGVDVWDVIACAATKPFGFQAFHPGPGVGGHCIPIDPHYLRHKMSTLGAVFRFVDLAAEINSQMPDYIVTRATGLLTRRHKPVMGADVLLLGITYKPDVADQRESPARPVAHRLRARGAAVRYHDPYAEEWVLDGRPVPRARDLVEAVCAADLTILLQDHAVYDPVALAQRARAFFDTRGRVRWPPTDHIELL